MARKSYIQSLKKPDEFVSAGKAVGAALQKRTRELTIGVIFLVVALVVAAIVLQQKRSSIVEGRNELFQAQVKLEKEFEAFQEKQKKETKPEAGKDKKEAAAAASTPLERELRYSPLDVEKTYGDSFKQLQEVAGKYDGTRPGFEAQLQVGKLYLNHGESKKALPWFEKAVRSAPGEFEKTLSHVAAATSLENVLDHKKALEHLNQALKEKVDTLKGEVLHGMARNHRALMEVDLAKKIYDQIITELPNSDYSKKAEIYRAQLP